MQMSAQVQYAPDLDFEALGRTPGRMTPGRSPGMTPSRMSPSRESYSQPYALACRAVCAATTAAHNLRAHLCGTILQHVDCVLQLTLKSSRLNMGLAGGKLCSVDAMLMCLAMLCVIIM